MIPHPPPPQGQSLEIVLIIDLIQYLFFCSLGLNIAQYKLHPTDFWRHRSQRHNGQRAERHFHVLVSSFLSHERIWSYSYLGI